MHGQTQIKSVYYNPCITLFIVGVWFEYNYRCPSHHTKFLNELPFLYVQQSKYRSCDVWLALDVNVVTDYRNVILKRVKLFQSTQRWRVLVLICCVSHYTQAHRTTDVTHNRNTHWSIIGPEREI